MNLGFDPANPTIDDDNIALYHQVEDIYHKAPKGTTLWVKPYGYALTMRDKPLEMTELLLKNTFVDGNRCFVEDSAYLLGCSTLVEQMIEVKNVEVEKL